MIPCVRWVLWSAPVLAACGRLGFGTDGDADARGASAFDAMPLGACDPRLTPSTVALYRFDGGAGDASDATGNHPGIWGDPVLIEDGPCGPAMSIAVTGYNEVAASPAWQLPAATIDLELRPGPANGTRAVLGRDEMGEASDGQVSVAMSPSNELLVRYQRGGTSVLRCSVASLTPDDWVHVTVALGPPGLALWIDGQAQVTAGTAQFLGIDLPCDGLATGGLDDDIPPVNDNRWVLGASNYFELPGATGGGDPLAGGALDHIRIRAGYHRPGDPD